MKRVIRYLFYKYAADSSERDFNRKKQMEEIEVAFTEVFVKHAIETLESLRSDNSKE